MTTPHTDRLRELIKEHKLTSDDVQVIDDESDEPKAEVVDGKLLLNRAMADAIGRESEQVREENTFTITLPHSDSSWLKPQPSPKRKKGGNKEWWLRR